MEKKTTDQNNSSKKTLIIVTVVIAVAVIAAAAALLLIPNIDRKTSSADSASQPSEETTAIQTTEAETGVTHAPEPETTLDIFIPTEAGSTVTHFNATFTPNGEITDLSTGKSMTLREVFGSSYADGRITFNEDKTFTDTLNGMSGVSTGMYNVENGKINAIYSNDRNMNITVTKWNDSKTVPEKFNIIYGDPETGFKVYF